MIPLAWNWSRKHFSLFLLLMAAGCLALALGKLVRGMTWSLLMPVSLFAALAGWGVGASRLNRKQAGASLSVVGLVGIFLYVAGLARPLVRITLSFLSVIPQWFLWIVEKGLIDTGPLREAWADLSLQVASVLVRLGEWVSALFVGKPLVDPVAAGVAWCLVLWLTGAWAGWQLRRNRRALLALAPAGLVLALVLDYTRRDTVVMVFYLALMLAMMGLARNEWLHLGWQRRALDYSESITVENLIMVGLVTAGLVFAAALVPSLSWRDLVEKLREMGHGKDSRVAESLGLEAAPNAALDKAYLAGGLPRQHLLDLPPEQLQDVVLVISTGELPPIPEMVHDLHPARHYWRALTYDFYSGAGWGSSAAEDVSLPANTSLLGLPPGYRMLHQHVKRTPGQRTTVLWSGLLAQADVDLAIAWRTKPPVDPSPVHNGDMLGAQTDREEFDVVSYLPLVEASRLREANNEYPADIARRYLQLPDSTPERVLRLARQLTQTARTPYERAISIESYLRTFPYTLEVESPPPGADVVDYFLFTAKKGYCDYYATSMVVLARAVGLPSRVVIGYASGEYDAPAAEYIVRQKDAHTWVEVYFSGVGWVEFEPTAGQPAIDRPGDENAAGPPSRLPAGQRAASWLNAGWRSLLSSLGGQFLLAGIAVALFCFLWLVGEMGVLRLIPAPRAIARLYSRMEKASAGLLPDLPGGHTPHSLAKALATKCRQARAPLLKRLLSPADREIEQIVSLHVAQAFTLRPPERKRVEQGIRAWSRLRWRLWIARRWIR